MSSECTKFFENTFKTSHLPIVDACSLELMKEKGSILIKAQLGKQKLKTIADILSDVLSVRKGHFVFPWRTKDKPIGFQYIFFIRGKPVFLRDEEYPISIPLEERYIEFPRIVEEDEVLDLWRRKLLWNAIGKKSLGRGRSLTHQTPWETEELINLLLEKNNNEYFCRRVNGGDNADGEVLSIHSRICDENGINNNDEIPEELNKVPINRIRWDNGNQFVVEKALEAWIMENVDADTSAGKDFREKVLGVSGIDQIVSFHNYLPFGVQGANIDTVIFTKNGEGGLVAHILELKKDRISFNQFKKYEKEEVEKYAKFIEKFLKKYGVENFEVKKGILSYEPSREEIEKYKKEYNGNTKWFFYKIDCTSEQKIIFNE